MALTLGVKNNNQVILLGVLGAFIVGFGGYQIYSAFSGPSQPKAAVPAQSQHERPQAARTTAPAQGTAAKKISNAGIDPTVHFEKLAQSEQITYTGTGRNIFSADSAPVAVPSPIAPARPNGANTAAQNTPPAAPKPPAIDLKYFGYEMDQDKSFKAFLLHGDDIFMARTGEIIDHRYKVGAIHPTNIELTDLAYNNTQTIPLTQ
jgi:hypothetical protein